MRLDFNETQILIHAIYDFQQFRRPINKASLVAFLNEMLQTTDKQSYVIIQAIRSLASKLEVLSEKSIDQICDDAKNNRIISTARYVVPRF